MTTLETLTTPLTSLEVRTAIYSALASSGVSTTTWKPGAVVRTIIAGVALVIAALSELQALIARSGFLELSSSGWLTLVARYVYDVERRAATFASGSVTVINGGGGIFSGDPGDLVFTIPGVEGAPQYRNTDAFSIGALATVVIPIEAIEAGIAGTKAAGSITEFVTPLLGCTVTQPTAVVGTDDETDEALRARCSAKTGTLSPNGPRDAYAYIATSAVDADGESIGVTRVRSIADGAGNVVVYVADASGEIASAANLAILDDDIQEQCVPLAVTATVESAVPVVIPVTYALWVRDTSSLTNTQIETAVAARLAEYMSAQPIGGHRLPTDAPTDPGNIYVSAIETVIGATAPDTIIRVQVTLPAATTPLAANEAPALGAVTASITQVVGGLI